MNENYIKEIFRLKQEVNNLKKELYTQITAQNYTKRQLKAIQEDFDSNVVREVEKTIKMYEKELNKMSVELLKKDTEKRKVIEKYKILKEKANKKEEEYEKLLEEYKKLKRENERLKIINNIDGTNSGVPTSMTPINKNKIIPNTRVKSDKNIGGQKGHKRHQLDIPEIISFKEEHKLEECPKCNNHDLIDTGKTIKKYVKDYKIVSWNTEHIFKVYKCSCCGKEIHKEIPENLKGEVQYGEIVKGQILSLVNVGNVPINKVRRIISGLSINIDPSEGYIAKLEKQASKYLDTFIKELREKILHLEGVYWDDTVIMVNTKRSCLRYYGNEKLALYYAHETKGKTGLDEDNILNLLPATTWVMHDHNKVNYNEDYSYINVECCSHLSRDLEKVSQNIPNRTWAKKLKDLFNKYNENRKKLQAKNKTEFTAEEINKFIIEVNDTIALGYEENSKDSTPYYANDELTLLNRIFDYRDNYIYWLYDFNIPYTNNLSERSLRGVKSKMKTAGQFQNIDRAKDYAKIKSYIETCHRNGINESYALEKLASGNPLTIESILCAEKNEQK